MIKSFKDIAFEECLQGENTLGYITDCSSKIEVLLLFDNMGDYLEFRYPMTGSEYCSDKVERCLTERVANGRHRVCDGTLVLSTIFPILDERFLHLQIRHALYEIWDMSCIAKGCPK